MRIRVTIENPAPVERTIVAKSGKEYTFINQVADKAEVIDETGNVKEMQTQVQISVRKNKDGSYWPELLPKGVYITAEGHYIDTYKTIKRSPTPVFKAVASKTTTETKAA